MAVLPLGIGWLAWLWQPERQVRLHQRDLVRRFEARAWSAVSGMVAEDYGDRWGHSKENLLQGARAALSHFLFLTFEGETVYVEMESAPGEALVQSRLRLAGRGSPLADEVSSRVNNLLGPFSFRWRRQSWKPWDWQLISADHPELNVERFQGSSRF